MRKNRKQADALRARLLLLMQAIALCACSRSAPNGGATADTAAKSVRADARPGTANAELPMGSEISGAAGTDTHAKSDRLLLDVVGSGQARVIAIVTGGKWLDPFSAAQRQVKAFAASRPSFTLLPSIAAGTRSAGRGSLAGPLKVVCGDLFVPFARDAHESGFAIAGLSRIVDSLPLERISLRSEQRAEVARLLAKETRLNIAVHIDAAYSVDLDGNGRPEVVVQATHPDLATDFAAYKPEYYSVLVVLPDRAAAEPTYVGYLQAIQPAGSFEVLTLDAVADVDGDGSLELLVRARHAEGFQVQVLQYGGRLTEVFRSVDGERNCEGSTR